MMSQTSMATEATTNIHFCRRVGNARIGGVVGESEASLDFAFFVGTLRAVFMLMGRSCQLSRTFARWE